MIVRVRVLNFAAACACGWAMADALGKATGFGGWLSVVVGGALAYANARLSFPGDEA